MLENFRFDQISFWIGFVGGMIFLWLFRQTRPIFQILRENFSARVSSVQRGISTSIEQRYRQDIVKLVQDKHLTAPLFSLEEIASDPLLLAPPPMITPGGAIPTEDLTDIAVPYLPDIGPVGGKFFVKNLTIPQAMAEGENLLLLGQPGSGKSFSVNLLTTWVAQRNPKAGQLTNLIPVSVHVADLELPAKKDRLAEVLYKALADRVSILVENRLLDFLKTTLQSRSCLVMVDGLDELPVEDQKPIIQYLQTLQQVYPGNRYIIAAGFENISSMEPLDLYPIALAGWTPKKQQAFVQRWSELWTEHITAQSWASELPDIYDPTILNRWILEDAGFDTPFYLTMRTWAAYAGDARGPGNVNAIEAYLLRMTEGKQNERGAMEQLASQITLTQTPLLTRKAAGSAVAAYEEDEIIQEPAVPSKASTLNPLEDEDLDALLDELDELDLELGAQADSQAAAIEEQEETAEDVSKREVRRMLPNLVDARVLVFQASNKVSFIHPIFCGFLAAANLARQNTPNALAAQKDWVGKTLAESFLSSQTIDLSKVIADKAQMAQKEPLKQSLIQTSSWLQHSPPTASWRPTLLRALAAALQQENLPLGIRVRILAGLATSREPTIDKLYKQMLQSPKHSVRWLGALGCGLIKDQGVVLELGNLLYDPSIFVSRAACLSLVTIGTTRALEMITTALLEANEEVRRAAAEALALHPEEGYAVLKEGVTIEDVLVRRAVVFGLARVEEPWARETLEQTVVEDDEWLVRNAALQIVEESKTDGPLVPKPIPPLHELPWLISFATERGQGVSPGQAAWDMLATVLKEGNEEQRLAAMQIYRRKPGEAISVINALLDILNGQESEVREAAHITLWHLQAFGLNLTM